MNYTLLIRPVVYAELEEIQEWYEQRQPGLGDKLEDHFKATLDRILKQPLRPPFVRGKTRRIEMKSFPYAVFYVVMNDIIHVLSVQHKRRSPDRWPRSSSN